MATVKGKRRQKGTVSGYFREIYREHPELLQQSSNAALIERWTADHPNHTEKELIKVKANLANLKSNLRKEAREGGKTKAHRGRAAATGSGNFLTGAASLEMLEEYIDECLTLAKNLDRTGLQSVIKLLRRARNEVVWGLTP